MIKLSVSDNGFALIRDAVVIFSESSSSSSKDVSMNIYDNLLKGLLKSRNFVQFGELLAIELDRLRVYNSLMTTRANERYHSKIISIYQAIDGLNCRYRYVFTKKSSVKRLVLEKKVAQTSNFEME